MKRKQLIKKTLVGFVAFVFVVSECLAGALPAWAAVTPLPVAVKSAEFSIELPSDLGKVQEVFEGKGDELVIHIQDAHAIYGVQKKISDIIQYLNSNHGFDLVAAEGASLGAVDTSVLSWIPDRELRDQVLDLLLYRSYITGPEYQHAISGQSFEYVGIENPVLYEQNRIEYLTSNEESSYLMKALSSFLSQVSDIKRRVYSDKLFQADRRIMENRQLEHAGSGEGFLKYLDWLVEYGQELKLDQSVYGNLLVWQSASKLNSEIDWKKLRREIAEIEAQLGRKEDAKRVRKLLNMETGPGMLEQLLTEMSDKDLKLEAFKNLEQYVQYAKSMSHVLETQGLLDEKKDLEDNILNQLLKTDEEKKTHSISHYLYLTQKLIQLKLTSFDFREYMESSHTLSEIAWWIKSYNSGFHVDSDMDRRLKAVSYFYKTAVKRDHVLIDNLMSEVRRSQKQKAVIVAGGFHTEGLLDLLKRKKISYMVIAPRVRSIESDIHEKYIAALKSERPEFAQTIINLLAQTLNQKPGSTDPQAPVVVASTLMEVGQARLSANVTRRRIGAAQRIERLVLNALDVFARRFPSWGRRVDLVDVASGGTSVYVARSQRRGGTLLEVKTSPGFDLATNPDQLWSDRSRGTVAPFATNVRMRPVNASQLQEARSEVRDYQRVTPEDYPTVAVKPENESLRLLTRNLLVNKDPSVDNYGIFRTVHQEIEEAIEGFNTLYGDALLSTRLVDMPLIGDIDGNDMPGISHQVFRILSLHAMRETDPERRKVFGLLFTRVIPIRNTLARTRFPGALHFLSRLDKELQGEVKDAFTNAFQTDPNFSEVATYQKGESRNFADLNAQTSDFFLDLTIYSNTDVTREAEDLTRQVMQMESSADVREAVLQDITATPGESGNQMVALIKPSSTHEGLDESMVRAFFYRARAFGYEPSYVRVIKGDQLPEQLLAAHYAEIAQFAEYGYSSIDGNPTKMGEKERQRIVDTYGSSTEFPIVGLKELERDHPDLTRAEIIDIVADASMDADQNSRWHPDRKESVQMVEKPPYSKYVYRWSHPKLYGGKQVLLANAHYANWIRTYTNPNNATVAVVLRPATKERANWQEMRKRFNGSTNLSKHDAPGPWPIAGTYRGDAGMGIMGNDADRISPYFNGLHLSAGPLEGSYETRLWRGDLDLIREGKWGGYLEIQETHFGRALRSVGYDDPEILRLEADTALKDELAGKDHVEGVELLSNLEPSTRVVSEADINTEAGSVIVVVGVSAAGKGTLVNHLVRKEYDAFTVALKTTTRTPRTYEREGETGYYVQPDKFAELESGGQLFLIQKPETQGGTVMSFGINFMEIKRAIARGKTAIIEAQTMDEVAEVRRRFPDAGIVGVFSADPPDLSGNLDAVTRRLKDRKLVEDEFQTRVANAEKGIRALQHLPDQFDDVEVIVNRDDQFAETSTTFVAVAKAIRSIHQRRIMQQSRKRSEVRFQQVKQDDYPTDEEKPENEFLRTVAINLKQYKDSSLEHYGHYRDVHEQFDQVIGQFEAIYGTLVAGNELINIPLIGRVDGNDAPGIGNQALRLLTLRAVEEKDPAKRKLWAALFTRVVPIRNTIARLRFPGVLYFLAEVDRELDGQIKDVFDHALAEDHGFISSSDYKHRDSNKFVDLHLGSGASFLSETPYAGTNVQGEVERLTSEVLRVQNQGQTRLETVQDIVGQGGMGGNEMLALIKPSSTHQGVDENMVRAFFQRARAFGYEPSFVRVIKGDALPEALIEAHYSEIAEFAKYGYSSILGNPSKMSEAEIEAINKKYGSVDQFPVKGLLEIIEDHPDLSREEIIDIVADASKYADQNSMWRPDNPDSVQMIEKPPYSKYVFRWSNPKLYDGKPILLANAHYANWIRTYTDPNSTTVAVVLRPAVAEHAHWHDMRKRFTGSPQLSKNDREGPWPMPGTFRGDVGMGIVGNDPNRITPYYNGLHLSAGPLEGSFESRIWRGDFDKIRSGEWGGYLAIEDTHFGRSMKDAGYSDDEVLRMEADTALKERLGGLEHEKGISTLSSLATPTATLDEESLELDTASVIVVVGVSTSGKGTLVNHLVRKDWENFTLALKSTTRAQRGYERHGHHGYYVDDAFFDDQESQGNFFFIQKPVVQDRTYKFGVNYREVKRAVAVGKTAILEAQTIEEVEEAKRLFPDAGVVVLFHDSPTDLNANLSAIEERLGFRENANAGEFEHRIALAREAIPRLRDLQTRFNNVELVVNAPGKFAESANNFVAAAKRLRNVHMRAHLRHRSEIRSAALALEPLADSVSEFEPAAIPFSDAVQMGRNLSVPDGSAFEPVQRILTTSPTRSLEGVPTSSFSVSDQLADVDVVTARERSELKQQSIEALRDPSIPPAEAGLSVTKDADTGRVVVEETLANDLLEHGLGAELAGLIESAELTAKLEAEGVENAATVAQEHVAAWHGESAVGKNGLQSRLDDVLYYFKSRQYGIEKTDGVAQEIAQALGFAEYDSHARAVVQSDAARNELKNEIIPRNQTQGAIIFTQNQLENGTITGPELLARVNDDSGQKIELHYIAHPGMSKRAALSSMKALLGDSARQLVYDSKRNKSGVLHIHTLSPRQSTQSAMNRVIANVRQRIQPAPNKSTIQPHQIVVIEREELLQNISLGAAREVQVSMFIDRGKNIGMLTAAYVFIPFSGRIPEHVFGANFSRGDRPNTFQMTPTESLGFFLQESAALQSYVASQA